MGTFNFVPLTVEELNERLRIQVPPTRARAGWVIDIDEVKRFCEDYNINFPIKFRYIKGKYRNGSHYSRGDSRPYHTITIHQDHIIFKANETLIHELVHAKQSEEFVRRTGKPHKKSYAEDYKLVDGSWGETYMGNLHEMEARRLAAELCSEYNIAK